MTVKQSSQSLTYVLINILGFENFKKSEWFRGGRVCLQWSRHKVLAMILIPPSISGVAGQSFDLVIIYLFQHRNHN